MAQVWRCYSQTAEFLQELGSSIDNTLYTTLFLTDMRDYPTFGRARRAFFTPNVPPASTSAMIGALPHPQAVFGFDGYAFVPDKNRPEHRMVTVNESRQLKHLRLADYGLAAKAGPLLFVAGVVAAQPERGFFVRRLEDLGADAKTLSTGSTLGDDLEGPMLAQTHFIYRVLKGILEENGSSLDHVLKTVIYLTDMRCLPSVERVSRSFFQQTYPATSICGTYQQARKDFLMEIDAIALMPGAPRAPRKESFAHTEAFPGTGYNTGITQAGEFLFTSAILPFEPKRGRIVTTPGDIADLGNGPNRHSLVFDNLEAQITCQAWYIHRTLQKLLEAHGAKMEDVLKVNLYLRDIGDFPAVARIAQEFFRNSPPAITPIQAADLPLKNALMQMDAIALRTQ